MNYVEVRYLYIDYVADRPRNFKIICKTENYSKPKYIVLRLHCTSYICLMSVVLLHSYRGDLFAGIKMDHMEIVSVKCVGVVARVDGFSKGGFECR
jgi:hypothetical protein